MYQPEHFQEQRLEVMHDLMRAHPLATLISYGEDGITADHVPLMLHADGLERGTLRGHIAKSNPMWQTCDQSIDVLAVFQGPHHYVTPSWYPTKKEHGKVVPTWNYAVVHASGPLNVIDDSGWLLEQVSALTSQHETGRDQPWAVSDAPSSYVDSMVKGIVGLEIPIAKIEGKWKVSQNRPDIDRDGVAKGLINENTDIAREMAKMTSQK